MKKPDYIDLLLDYLDGKLDKELADDIKNTLPNDPVLNTTVEGLAELYEEHNKDREALRQYFKETETEITNNLIKKGYRQKKTSNTKKNNWLIISIIFGIGLFILGWWFWSYSNEIKPTLNNNIPIDTIENVIDSSNFKDDIPQNQDKPNFEDDKNKESPKQNNTKSEQDETSNIQQVIALKYNGTLKPVTYIDRTIKSNFRGDNNNVLLNTSFRDTFYFTQNNYYELSKEFSFSENAILDKITLSFFNADTVEKQERFRITTKDYNYKEKLPEGLYYWSIKTKKTIEIYSSILILKSDAK